MDQPFLVFKQHLNKYNHKAFATVNEAHKAIECSDDFPGEYVSVYNLATKRFIHQEQFPWLNIDRLLEIVNLYQ